MVLDAIDEVEAAVEEAVEVLGMVAALEVSEVLLLLDHANAYTPLRVPSCLHG